MNCPRRNGNHLLFIHNSAKELAKNVPPCCQHGSPQASSQSPKELKPTNQPKPSHAQRRWTSHPTAGQAECPRVLAELLSSALESAQSHRVLVLADVFPVPDQSGALLWLGVFCSQVPPGRSLAQRTLSLAWISAMSPSDPRLKWGHCQTGLLCEQRDYLQHRDRKRGWPTPASAPWEPEHQSMGTTTKRD